MSTGQEYLTLTWLGVIFQFWLHLGTIILRVTSLTVYISAYNHWIFMVITLKYIGHRYFCDLFRQKMSWKHTRNFICKTNCFCLRFITSIYKKWTIIETSSFFISMDNWHLNRWTKKLVPNTNLDTHIMSKIIFLSLFFFQKQGSSEELLVLKKLIQRKWKTMQSIVTFSFESAKILNFSSEWFFG